LQRGLKIMLDCQTEQPSPRRQRGKTTRTKKRSYLRRPCPDEKKQSENRKKCIKNSVFALLSSDMPEKEKTHEHSFSNSFGSIFQTPRQRKRAKELRLKKERTRNKSHPITEIVVLPDLDDSCSEIKPSSSNTASTCASELSNSNLEQEAKTSEIHVNTTSFSGQEKTKKVNRTTHSRKKDRTSYQQKSKPEKKATTTQMPQSSGCQTHNENQESEKTLYELLYQEEVPSVPANGIPMMEGGNSSTALEFIEDLEWGDLDWNVLHSSYSQMHNSYSGTPSASLPQKNRHASCRDFQLSSPFMGSSQNTSRRRISGSEAEKSESFWGMIDPIVDKPKRRRRRRL